MIIKTSFPPTPQQRPRVTWRRLYDPSKRDKAKFIWMVRSQLPDTPIKTPIQLTIAFFFKHPKSHFNSKGELKRLAPTYHTKKPDVDNLIKFVMDAFNGRLYVDDSQVISIAAKKIYAKKEGIEISVTQIDEPVGDGNILS